MLACSEIIALWGPPRHIPQMVAEGQLPFVFIPVMAPQAPASQPCWGVVATTAPVMHGHGVQLSPGGAAQG